MTDPHPSETPSHAVGDRIRDERQRNADEGVAAGDGREPRAAEREPPGADDRETDARSSENGQSSEETPHLDEREKRRADEEEELNVGVTYEVIRRAGRDELRRSSSALFWSGLAAGLSMGFSLVTEGLLRAHLPDAPWTPLIAKFGYCVGFLAVILGAQQLFTENTLTAVIPLLAHRTRDALLNTLRLWGVVLVANLIGAFLFALVLSQGSLFPPEVVRAFDGIAAAALAHDAGHNFALAIFAGWLIALMVWMLPAAQQVGVIVIIIMTWVVGIAELPHIIAGGVEAFYGGLHGLAPWSTVFLGYILPTLAGNIVGGTTLVSGLAHAQVVAGRR